MKKGPGSHSAPGPFVCTRHNTEQFRLDVVNPANRVAREKASNDGTPAVGRRIPHQLTANPQSLLNA